MIISELFDKKLKEVGVKNVYLIGCTHFCHHNVVMFERDMFKDIEDHDNYIVDLINARVREDDILIHLGDVGSAFVMDRINCKNRFLIKGNHDTKSNEYYEQYFSQVFANPVYVWNRILLSHEPQIKSTEVLNVHAHLHNSVMKEQERTRDYLNVGVHMTGKKPGSNIIKKDMYKLYTLDNLIKILHSIPKVPTKFLYEEYSESYQYIKVVNDIVLNDDDSIDIEKSRSNRALFLSQK